MVSVSCGGHASPAGRLRGFLTLVLQRLARGRGGERLPQLGLRVRPDVRVLDRRHRLRDRGLQGGEVGGERGEPLEELPGGSIRSLLRALLERVEARLELLRRRVELRAKL